MIKVIAILFLLLSQFATAEQVAKEGFITLNVPHTKCQNHCASLLLSKHGKTIQTIDVKELQSITISGLENGTYQADFLQTNSITKKETVTFTVDHHAMRFAVTLFIVGGLLFSVLIFSIIKLHQNLSKHDFTSN